MRSGTAVVERVFREEYGRLIASLVRVNHARELSAAAARVERRTGCRTPENDDPPSRCLADPLAEAALIALTGSRVLGAGVRKKHPQG